MLIKARAEDTTELWLFYSEDIFEGWLSFFWISEEHYLQCTACDIRRGTKQALAELLELLKTNFFYVRRRRKRFRGRFRKWGFAVWAGMSVIADCLPWAEIDGGEKIEPKRVIDVGGKRLQWIGMGR